MGLFGKRKITANKLFSDADELLSPTRQSIEKDWWPIVEIEERAVEFKSQVVTELLLSHLLLRVVMEPGQILQWRDSISADHLVV